MGRYESLHALRGLAALLVAVGHAFFFPMSIALQPWWFGGRTLAEVTGGISEPFKLFHYLPSGQYPVACFFLLSGFVIDNALSATSPLRFIIGRVFRIYPVFLVAVAASALAWISLGRELPSLPKFLAQATLTGNQSLVTQAWTLLAEVKYYVAVSVLAFVTMPGWMRAWVFIALYAATGTHEAYWLSFMALGALMFQATTAHTGWRLASLAAGVLAWLAIAHVLHGWPAEIRVAEIVGALFTFVCALAFFSTARMPRVLMWLGDISYPLYCTHLIIILAGYFLLAGRLPSPYVQLIPLALSLPVAWAIHVGIEAPSIRAGKSLQSRVTAMKARKHTVAELTTGANDKTQIGQPTHHLRV